MHLRCIVHEKMAQLVSSDSEILDATGLFAEIVGNKIIKETLYLMILQRAMKCMLNGSVVWLL